MQQLSPITSPIGFEHALPATAAKTALRVLLIGPGASEFAPALSTITPIQTTAVTSFIEAILTPAHPAHAAHPAHPAHVPFDLILANMTEDADALFDAVAAFRIAHPFGRLVLMCDPWHEPQCRRAQSAGVQDYLILPTTLDALRPMLLRSAPRPSTGSAAAAQLPRQPIVIKATPEVPVHSPLQPIAIPAAKEAAPIRSAFNLSRTKAAGIPQAGASITATEVPPAPAIAPLPPQLGGIFDEETELERLIEAANQDHIPAPKSNGHKPQLLLPQLPLMVQTATMDDLLSGKTDIAGKALSIAQTYLPWPGKLHLHPPTETVAPNASQLHAPLAYDSHSFGTLTLTTDKPDAISAQFHQTAQWLTGWMALARRHEQLRGLAVTDELSGAYNRRYFMQFVSRLIDKARESRNRVTLLLFDIDDFKKYNDTYGHAAGDAIIKELIRLMRHCTRPHDLVARLGGDEFAVVFWDNEAPRQPNSDHPRSAIAATERFRAAVEKCDWNKISNIAGQVSISGGIASYPWDAKTLEDLLAVADAALLRAKRQGKNVIVLHEPAEVSAEAQKS